jgi:divalent metal cation (Fe/Co/Zn/Cd) transporter
MASFINGALGLYLVSVGKKQRSLILEAYGKHVLTDCWTSLGVVLGLGLAMLTGWLQ